MGPNQNSLLTKHVIIVAVRMLTQYTRTATNSVSCATSTHLQKVKFTLIKWQPMSTTKAQPNGCRKETSQKKLVNSLGFSEMETRYASHILQGMEFFKDSN